MSETSIRLKKEQIERFESTKEINRRKVLEKRKQNRRSDHISNIMKRVWEHEDSLRLIKRQKRGLA